MSHPTGTGFQLLGTQGTASAAINVHLYAVDPGVGCFTCPRLHILNRLGHYACRHSENLVSDGKTPVTRTIRKGSPSFARGSPRSFPELPTSGRPQPGGDGGGQGITPNRPPKRPRAVRTSPDTSPLLLPIVPTALPVVPTALPEQFNGTPVHCSANRPPLLCQSSPLLCQSSSDESDTSPLLCQWSPLLAIRVCSDARSRPRRSRATPSRPRPLTPPPGPLAATARCPQAVPTLC